MKHRYSIAGITAIRLHYNKEGSDTRCAEKQNSCVNLSQFFYGMDIDSQDAVEVISHT